MAKVEEQSYREFFWSGKRKTGDFGATTSYNIKLSVLGSFFRIENTIFLEFLSPSFEIRKFLFWGFQKIYFV